MIWATGPRGNLFERRNIDYIRNPWRRHCKLNGQTFEGTHEARYTTKQLDKRIKLMDARRRLLNTGMPYLWHRACLIKSLHLWRHLLYTSDPEPGLH